MSKTVIQVIVNENDITDIKTIEIPATAFQALNFKRVDFVKFKEYDVSKPGIYLLLGQSDNEITKLYIGETTNLKERLKYHFLNKDFWNEAIVFYSKNNEISSSHIKYVEAKLISMVNKDIEIELDNSKSQIIPVIDSAGEIIAIKYLENLLFLLSALRFDYFTNDLLYNTKSTIDTQENKVFILKTSYAIAKMKRENGKYVLLKNSIINAKEQSSISEKTKNIRRKLIEENILVKNNENSYELTDDFAADSSSVIGAVVSGYSISGPQNWKYDNKTLKQIEEEEVK
jgi:hypothetical protein